MAQTMPQPAQQQQSQQQLVLPTLYALLPQSNYPRFISRLSLLAIHVSPYTVRDDIYNPTNTVLPQQRTLRLRARRRFSKASVKGKEKAVVVDDDENWDYDMSYVSGLINASEYRDMEVRSYVGVGVVDPKSRVGIETFLETMDFRLVPPFRPKVERSLAHGQTLTQLCPLWACLSHPDPTRTSPPDYHTHTPRRIYSPLARPIIRTVPGPARALSTYSKSAITRWPGRIGCHGAHEGFHQSYRGPTLVHRKVAVAAG